MFSGKSLADWLTENVLVLAIVIVAIGVLTQANTGETRKAITAAGITLVALFMVGAASHANDIGGWLYQLATGQA